MDHYSVQNQKTVPYRSSRKYRWNHNTELLFLDDTIAPILLEKLMQRRLCDLAYVTQPPDLEQGRIGFLFSNSGQTAPLKQTDLRQITAMTGGRSEQQLTKFNKAGLESFSDSRQEKKIAFQINFCSKISPTVASST